MVLLKGLKSSWVKELGKEWYICHQAGDQNRLFFFPPKQTHLNIKIEGRTEKNLLWGGGGGGDDNSDHAHDDSLSED